MRLRARPVWGWAFDDRSRRARAQAGGAAGGLRLLRHGGARTAGSGERGGAAVALWIPPGEPAMSPADAERFPSVVAAPAVPSVPRAHPRLMAAFEAAHPHGAAALLPEPARHPSRPRWPGPGHGAPRREPRPRRRERRPAYLESSNPTNVGRYERLGFSACEAQLVPGIAATQMWRRPTSATGLSQPALAYELRQLLLQLEHGGEEVAVLLDPLEHVAGLEDEGRPSPELGGGLDLVPGDRGRDGGALAGPQRVDGDRRFAAVVLATSRRRPCPRVRPFSFSRRPCPGSAFRAAGRSLWRTVWSRRSWSSAS